MQRNFDSKVIDGWMDCTEATLKEYMCLRNYQKTDRVGMHKGGQLLERLLSTSTDQAADLLFVSWNRTCQ